MNACCAASREVVSCIMAPLLSARRLKPFFLTRRRAVLEEIEAQGIATWPLRRLRVSWIVECEPNAEQPRARVAGTALHRELCPVWRSPGIVTGQDLVQKSMADLIAESTAVAFAGGVVLVLAALGIVGV